MCEVLDKLETLTTELPNIPQLSDFKEVYQGITKYVFDTGISHTENIHSEEDIAIAKIIMPEGLEFSPHFHKISAEWLIVLEGSLKVVTEEEEVILNKYDSVKLKASKPHSTIALESVVLIAITVPKDDGFPE